MSLRSLSLRIAERCHHRVVVGDEGYAVIGLADYPEFIAAGKACVEDIVDGRIIGDPAPTGL